MTLVQSNGTTGVTIRIQMGGLILIFHLVQSCMIIQLTSWSTLPIQTVYHIKLGMHLLDCG